MVVLKPIERDTMSKRYSDVERSLIATVLGTLGYNGTRNFLSGAAPSTQTLRKVSEEYDIVVPSGVEEVAPSKKSNGSSNPKRSRRYTDEDKARLAELIAQHGLTGTQQKLGDDAPSMVTLSKIAQDYQVELTRGRPKAA